MNPTMVGSAIRWVLTTFGALLIGYGAKKGFDLGFITTEPFIGGLIAVVTFLWGLWAKTDKNLIISASQVPAVTQVNVTDPQLARTVAPVADATITANNRPVT